MTNPGHIDPGYHGHLHLTAINMGREPFEVRRGDLIMTLVIVGLSNAPKADFNLRYGSSSPSHITRSQLDRLSSDFANVHERAEAVAEKAVLKADLSIKKAQTRAALIGTVVTACIAIFTLYWNSQSNMNLLSQEYLNLDKKMDDKINTVRQVDEIQKQTQDLQRQLTYLQNQLAELRKNSKGR